MTSAWNVMTTPVASSAKPIQRGGEIFFFGLTCISIELNGVLLAAGPRLVIFANVRVVVSFSTNESTIRNWAPNKSSRIPIRK